MEEKNDDLDNLIIQSDKSSGLKKILLAAAVLLLVLIIIILVTKSLIQPEQKAKSSIILPPAPTTQAQPAEKEPLFQEVPIQEEKPRTKTPEKRAEKVVPQPVKKPVAPQPAPTAQTPGTTPTPQKAETPAVAVPSKPTPKPKTTKRTSKKAPNNTLPKSGRYYIQVGAFFRYPPDKKFLGSIEKEGLHYVIVVGKKNGTSYKKVMVGPYPTRSAAKKDLPRIKRRINQNAYITKK